MQTVNAPASSRSGQVTRILSRASVVAVLAVSIVFVFLEVRFFPFSNYPMYAQPRDGNSIYVLVVNYADGTSSFVDNLVHNPPFSRRHIHQMILVTLRRTDFSRRDFRWVRQLLFNRMRASEKVIDSVSVAKAILPFPFRGDEDFANTELRPIKKLKWPGR